MKPLSPEKRPDAVLFAFTTPPFRVTYAETDKMGFVYYANYLEWFEIGRVELLRSLGSSYRDWEDIEGIFLPVRHCEIRYLASARYDDMVRVHTTVTRLTPASIRFHYRITRQEPSPADEPALAEGSTEHVFVNPEGKIRRAVPRLLPALWAKQNETA